MRETLFWFLLYITYVMMQEREKNVSYKSQACKQIYIADILQISWSRTDAFLELIDTLLVTYHPLFELRIKLDDNVSHFALGLDNRSQYITNKSADQVVTDLSWDDIVRCRGFYKTITYYNKRIVKPK